MKRILIFYSHFSPAYKAGGPVQSLTNLAEGIGNNYLLYIVCSAYEMGESEVLEGIHADRWNEYNNTTKVFYATRISWQVLKTAMREVSPDVIYINGLFLPFFTWLPLYLAKLYNKKVVLAPRGMLQQGALAVKPLKKRIFLILFKVSRLIRAVRWHATDDQEAMDIKRIFGSNSEVMIAPNIPKTPVKPLIHRVKMPKSLKLIYLSLITEKKNLALVLETLREINTPVELDIYGPVIDTQYWERCQQLMHNQIHTITYKGSVRPLEVQTCFQHYHALILPTKGENFGHAIYEAMSAGTVPLISSFTPWKNLEEREAGLIVNSWQTREWALAIERLVNMNQSEFNTMSENAFSLADSYFKENDFQSAYDNLFG